MEYLDGERETVTVWQLPIRVVESQAFQANWHLESYLLWVATKLKGGVAAPEEWGDGLTGDSHDRVVDLARELNRPSWLRRNLRRVRWLTDIGFLDAKSASSTGSSTPPES
ncbi:hypothetical protein MLD52_09185 [Puniceicoccaceae bacterium K14]|nr:hypothetical protein [Puniceicoccaceae bacterium K14]